MASHKILLVEDFEDLRNLVSFYLSAHGYDVLEAPTRRAAIEIAVSGNPDLVLLDLRLPGIAINLVVLTMAYSNKLAEERKRA